MTNEAVLIKAIQRAHIAPTGYDLVSVGKTGTGNLEVIFESSVRKGVAMILSPERIIFSHDFAKALWGDGLVERYSGLTEGEYGPHEFALILIPRWQYHLQQMVLADDPIKYLGEHLS